MFHCLFYYFREERAIVRGSGRAAAALGARAQLLRGAHDALGRGALALHHGRLRLQGVHAEGHAAQAGRRAQPRWPLRPSQRQHQTSSFQYDAHSTPRPAHAEHRF